MCVLNTESCTIFAIEAKTGKQLWSFWLGDPLTSSPTIADGLVFAAYPAQGAENGTLPPGVNHALAAFDLETGKIKWQLWLDGDVMSRAGRGRRVPLCLDVRRHRDQARAEDRQGPLRDEGEGDECAGRRVRRRESSRCTTRAAARPRRTVTPRR